MINLTRDKDVFYLEVNGVQCWFTMAVFRQIKRKMAKLEKAKKSNKRS